MATAAETTTTDESATGVPHAISAWEDVVWRTFLLGTADADSPLA